MEPRLLRMGLWPAGPGVSGARECVKAGASSVEEAAHAFSCFSWKELLYWSEEVLLI